MTPFDGGPLQVNPFIDSAEPIPNWHDMIVSQRLAKLEEGA